jgi:hypothetical protein
MIDKNVARDFLMLLDPDGSFTFQTFDDRSSGASSGLARVLHGRFEDVCAELESLNDAGAGVFVMVNAGNGIVKPGSRTCRTAANVVRVRANFVDLDGAPIGPILDATIPPDWLVESSPGRWHAYWTVYDCPISKFEAMQSALAAKFDGDRSVKDLPRVMRVPGFFHRKRERFLSTLYLPDQYEALKGAPANE